VFVTPSEYKKPKHKETFLDLMEMFGLGREHVSEKVKQFTDPLPARSGEFDFSFSWNGQAENASYEPLREHLLQHGVVAVKVCPILCSITRSCGR